MYQLTILVFLGWLLSLCLHEFGHAIAAYWGGDTSVKEKGYLTLNPLKYVDPVLSLILPMLFLLIGGIGLPGAAVYINTSQIRNRFWLSLTSIAGPLASFVATIILVVIYKLIFSQLSPSHLQELSQLGDLHPLPTDPFLASLSPIIAKYWFVLGLAVLIYLQVFVTIFNLLPVPFLDGYGVIEPWLSKKWQKTIEPLKQYGFAILIALFWFSPAFSRQFSRWCYQLTGLLTIDREYIQTGFTLFEKASPPLAIGIFIIFAIARKLTTPKHRALYESALAYQRTGKLDAALRDLDKAIAIQPDFSQALLLKADILFQRKNYAEAICIWEPWLCEHPNDLGIEQHLILAQWNLGHFTEALARCDRLLSEIPNNAYICQLKAGILKNLHRDDEALEACDRGIALEPQTTYLWQLKGEILWKKECLEEALQVYRQVVEIDRKSISAWIAQAKILIALNQLENALACSDRALQIDPRELISLDTHSYILCLLREYDAAIDFIDRILRIDAKNALAYYNKACCYAEQKQLSLAIAQLKSALLYGDRDLKEKAKTDESFANIRDSLEFQQLMV
ncbi:tetratricopeptide repeat protein [Tumidithrix elongata RA019]|uniref:Tetratricopeptide repeat protein n=1 Tax=Tumidithrix elongata BACA0141 TaxID=2716417 RepID=A0AAW9Q1E1_9CYAN|nr:tetratricopeptide repeat protein [Tumidithrix elongata RA019]